jgi:cation:H+ antiporter
MELLLQIAIFVGSLAVLIKASDWFVESAERIGLSWGISPFIIGVTIVAFGTSLPELATSIAAVLENQSEIVIGNVVGSNITNIALVLGITALWVRNIELDGNIWYTDIPYLWGSAAFLYFVVRDGSVSFFDAIVLLGGIAIFLANSFKGDEYPTTAEEEHPAASWRDYALLVFGGVLVWLSADWVIGAISKISVMAGIPPKIIALSAVAVGTSLPEVVVSLAAARRGKSAIAVGNVLGSNIFNTYFVIAVPSFFGPLVIPLDILDFYLPLMIVMTILFGVMANNRNITRWEGSLLLLFYVYFFGTIIQSV